MLKFKTIIGIAVTLLLWHQMNAQSVTLADRDTKQGVPYATIVDSSSSLGFVSDFNGNVELSDMNSNSILHIRSIGYGPLQIKAEKLQDGDTIYLNSLMLELEEVIVRPITAFEYVQQALRSAEKNYYPDSFVSNHYYKEQLTENGRYLTHTEAFLTAIQPGYHTDQDSFEVYIHAGKAADGDELAFMEKERDKDYKKEQKKAKKKGEAFNEEDYDYSLELGNPNMLLYLDPLRHPSRAFEVNDDDVDFLDSANHELYEYWYGRPVALGERTLVVVHFDQRKKVKKPLMKGTIWIDQASDAFVKISFGFSDQGLDHLVPTYAKAAMWLYGLSYDIGKTRVEFEYTSFKNYYTLAATRMDAELNLEKRRFFDDNELAKFDFNCEMLTTNLNSELGSSFEGVKYDKSEVLSAQLPMVDEETWKTLKASSRKRQH